MHLACGTKYLSGYTNIDVRLPESHLASERPDLVKKNLVTWSNYYPKTVERDAFLSGKLHHSEIVCDLFSDIRNLPYLEDTVDEILGVQVFEHFSFPEGKKLLFYWYDLLREGGVLHLDIPDLDGTIEIYKDDPVWATRLLYGSQKNEYGIHKAMYTKESITKLFEEVGFRNIEILPNIHTYPAFGIKGVK